ncbi:hypothetical protein SLEP1_g48178 [Rubroshorea leprosula]|uniref:Uncharacterized protein n=1 Tax=Rubroshorea leprosula TaxID=152421 RepID=A0AAV5LSY1_9ROSI|nr:hypothetical protein SLEP1_g48178 [Rubroshorea leprosula]
MGKMKDFAVQVEEAREGQDGKPSVGPIYRNLLSKNEFPLPDPDMATTWDIFSLTSLSKLLQYNG